MRIKPGCPGFGKGPGEYRWVPTGAKARGDKTMIAGSIICCLTCCPLGFFMELDEMEELVWVVPDGYGPYREYEVSNELLQTPAGGVAYRVSKELSDIDNTIVAPWGSSVWGRELEDGWLLVKVRLDDVDGKEVRVRFLPVFVNGKRVLKPKVKEADCQLETPLPQDMMASEEQGAIRISRQFSKKTSSTFSFVSQS